MVTPFCIRKSPLLISSLAFIFSQREGRLDVVPSQSLLSPSTRLHSNFKGTTKKPIGPRIRKWLLSNWSPESHRPEKRKLVGQPPSSACVTAKRSCLNMKPLALIIEILIIVEVTTKCKCFCPYSSL